MTSAAPIGIARIGADAAERHAAEVVGAKAANLARVAALGVPVPPAFVLPIELCAAILRADVEAEHALLDRLAEGVAWLERATDRRLGDRRRPLLVAVRSGAAKSMPGMMDTVLDVGCTSAAVRGLMRATGNPRFAWDCRRRFIESFATVVLGAEPASFAARLADALARERVASEDDLDSEAVERVAADFQALVEENHGSLDDPMSQLAKAARAVYRSWASERARTYRRLQKLESLQGTAVMVQAMVFGNRGRSSGTGVAFSRDPSTGAARPVVDVLFDAQGEDVVSGRRTPETEEAIARSFPALAVELRQTLARLEREFADVQDVEFTIEEGRLWILQTRAAKRTPRAALRIAIDLVRAGMISRRDALARLEGIEVAALAEARFADPGRPAAVGRGASAGVATGRAAFDSESAQRLAAANDPVVLVRPDTRTEDVAGFAASAGIVTAVGGRTAHAALVARQMGKPCVVGCAALAVDLAARRARLGDETLGEGEWISIDGGDGAVYLGRREIAIERPDADLAEIERWRAAAGPH